ncbi:MAG: uroporphyrinogen-III synthase [Hydrogenophilus sp.]|nr:uroporphyrinogen-III synthase [Hydrogenophilus sp.]
MGKRAVWVTRPASQSERLLELVEMAGFEAVAAPLLSVVPAVEEKEAEFFAAGLDRFIWVFFVSANAAKIAVPAIRRYRPWPPGPPVATVGRASAMLLRTLGFSEVLVPERGGDSEAVLALSWTQRERVAGEPILIVKGIGGRPLLETTLADRGANVATWCCYRRLAGVWDKRVWAPWEEGRVKAMLVTSSEAVRFLPEVIPIDRWPMVRASVLAVANHPRVAAALREIGWERVATAAELGDEALVATLRSELERER